MVDKTKVIRVFEAFAGMGAQRKALTNNKQNYLISGLAEWYVPAIISYQAIHNKLSPSKIIMNIKREDMIDYLESLTLSMNSKEPVSKGYWKRKNLDDLRLIYTAVKMSEKEGNIFDVRTLYQRKLSDTDLLTYSFPCQDLSQQGKQKGMKRNGDTRSGLLWEIEKALESTPKDKLPKYLLMENVMALSYKTNKTEFKEWIEKLESLGYSNDWKVLNAAEFGSSQARRRVFMISSLKNSTKLPIGTKSPKAISCILNQEVRDIDILIGLNKYDLEEYRLTKSNLNKSKLINYTSFNSEAYVYDPNYTGPTLTASGANSRIKINHNGEIRKMNAEEAYRYMGFQNKDYKKVKALNYLIESKMIYTCGNSISVEVLEAIFKEITNE